MDHPRQIVGWVGGIRLREEWLFNMDPDLARLSMGTRLAYKLAGAFKIVQRAHRIVYYRL